ncbi:2-amino-3-ketobutyrate coenzyme A ligase [Huso huso]|uniref:2-amino-3-ketobutyrate coenzyme A ligase n=1 Tax=Huso huso TaxID=61971 RepID=A0ABR0YFP1_HUSHU
MLGTRSVKVLAPFLAKYPPPLGQLLTRRGKSALAHATEILEKELAGIKEAGTWKSERVITSKQGARIRVEGTDTEVLNFCANNYLGLSEFTPGQGLPRFTGGRGLHGEDLHKSLERKLAAFHQRDDAILYPSCFDANAGIFEVLLSSEDAVLSDELNHASIIDGIRLCKAHKYRYRHLDMRDLESKLQESQKHRLRLIVTDGVFSMDGDVAPLPQICDLAERHGALVFIDECHATGFMGATGRGTDELLGVMGRVHIINSTLGKALGGAAGGYTVGPGPLISLLRQRSRPYLFSNSLPPAVVGSAARALELLMGDSEIHRSVRERTRRFRSKMTAAGFSVSGAEHPICPVMLGDARLASTMADDLLQRGEEGTPPLWSVPTTA